MRDYVTKDDLQGALKVQTGDITDVMREFMVQIDERFNKGDEELTMLNESYTQLLNTIDTSIGRFMLRVNVAKKRTNR